MEEAGWYFLIVLFIYLFLAVLGLCCCMGFSLVVARGDYFLAVLCRLLIGVASLVAERGLQGVCALELVLCGFSSCCSWTLKHRLSSCSAQVLLLCGMWDIPRPGIEPVFLVQDFS